MPADEQFTLRDEANAITAYAFRNGYLERLHAGEHSELLESKKYSRITDAEMKTLMIGASKKVEELLQFKAKDSKGYDRFIRDYWRKYCTKWER